MFTGVVYAVGTKAHPGSITYLPRDRRYSFAFASFSS
jgi:hypothetical protein